MVKYECCKLAFCVRSAIVLMRYELSCRDLAYDRQQLW